MQNEDVFFSEGTVPLHAGEGLTSMQGRGSPLCGGGIPLYAGEVFPSMQGRCSPFCMRNISWRYS